MKSKLNDEQVQALIITRCETDEKFANEVFRFLEPEMLDKEEARTDF